MHRQHWSHVERNSTGATITFAWGSVTIPSDVIEEAERLDIPISRVLRRRYEQAAKRGVLERINALREFASKACALEAEWM